MRKLGDWFMEHFVIFILALSLASIGLVAFGLWMS